MNDGDVRPRCRWYVNAGAFVVAALIASAITLLAGYQWDSNALDLVVGPPSSLGDSGPSSATSVVAPGSSTSTMVVGASTSSSPSTTKAGPGRASTSSTTSLHREPLSSVPFRRMDNLAPVVARAPSFAERPPEAEEEGPVLEVQSVEENEITDEGSWLTESGLERPLTPPENLTGDVPSIYRGAQVIGSIASAGRTFLLYGPKPELAVYLVAADLGRGVAERVWDFSAYTRAPESEPGEEDLVEQGIRWAAQVGDVLYVSHAHSTYARSSMGMNAYLTALDASSGAVLWRSGPLVANAKTFEVVGDVIVSGYGFTAESDYLNLLDRETGALLRRQRIESAPTYIIQKGDTLYVRCYNRDYVFQLSQKP